MGENDVEIPIIVCPGSRRNTCAVESHFLLAISKISHLCFPMFDWLYVDSTRDNKKKIAHSEIFMSHRNRITYSSSGCVRKQNMQKRACQVCQECLRQPLSYFTVNFTFWSDKKICQRLSILEQTKTKDIFARPTCVLRAFREYPCRYARNEKFREKKGYRQNVSCLHSMPSTHFMPNRLVMHNKNCIYKKLVMPTTQFIPNWLVMPSTQFIPNSLVMPSTQFTPNSLVMTSTLFRLSVTIIEIIKHKTTKTPELIYHVYTP